MNFYKKKQLADLKKQISEERTVSGTLLGRMKADAEEFDKTKLDAEKKRQIVRESHPLNLD